MITVLDPPCSGSGFLFSSLSPSICNTGDGSDYSSHNSLRLIQSTLTWGSVANMLGGKP